MGCCIEGNIEVNVELLSDMLLLIENGNNGGIVAIPKRYGKTKILNGKRL